MFCSFVHKKRHTWFKCCHYQFQGYPSPLKMQWSHLLLHISSFAVILFWFILSHHWWWWELSLHLLSRDNSVHRKHLQQRKSLQCPRLKVPHTRSGAYCQTVTFTGFCSVSSSLRVWLCAKSYVKGNWCVCCLANMHLNPACWNLTLLNVIIF